MKKFDKWYNDLIDSGRYEIASNGEGGYFVTVGELLDNGGKNEFFRTTRKAKNGKLSVSRNVFYNLEYDRNEKKWYADNYNDISGTSKGLKKTDIIFFGFTF